MIVATSESLAEKIRPAAARLDIMVGVAHSPETVLALKPAALITEAGNPTELNLLFKIRESNPALPRIVAFSKVAIPMNVMISMRIGHRFIDLNEDSAALASIIGDAVRLTQYFMSEEIQKYVRNLAFLPRLPDLYVRVEEAVHAPGSSLSKAAEIIERDQTVTSLVLKLVNAAAFAGKKPVTKIGEAVTRIGINNLKAIILAVSIFSGKIGYGGGIDFNSLHTHAFTVARCSRRLAESEGLPPWSQDMIFLAGLLHDIGALVLLTSNGKLYEETLIRAQTQNLNMLELEKTAFGVDHAVLGGYVSRLWGFPDMISELIMHHHGAPKEDVSFRIVQAADALTQKLLYQGRGEGIPSTISVSEEWAKICKPILQEIAVENAAALSKKK
ncbi:MAG: HDOD domain-containing protein [Spirochaetes bacterium]|nr:HDOD domain-containing protein [Spirochaetota bacterium]